MDVDGASIHQVTTDNKSGNEITRSVDPIVFADKIFEIVAQFIQNGLTLSISHIGSNASSSEPGNGMEGIDSLTRTLQNRNSEIER